MDHGALYSTYAFLIKLFGFEKSIARFLDQLDLTLPPDAAILDVGCGTAIIGLTLMGRAPKSTLVATDLNQGLLEEARQNAVAHNIDPARVTIGVSDISHPEIVRALDGSPVDLSAKKFDMVATGAVVGYARDEERALNTLLDMVKPGGYFLNIEMDETLVGRMTSKRYRYPVMPLARMEQLIVARGFKITRIPVRTFPARLTRMSFLARKQ